MDVSELKTLVDSLVALHCETEWVEFKADFHSKEEIGEQISALSNSACLHKKPFGYLVFGIEDETHYMKGCKFRTKSHKKGNEELEVWLCQRLNPKIDFESYDFVYSENINIALYKIPAATNTPITFLHKSYIRVGSITKLLSEYKEKEAKIWRNTEERSIENKISKTGLSQSDIIKLLSTETYFDLMKIPYPQDTSGVLGKLTSEGIVLNNNGYYEITELGAILFAKDLSEFGHLNRKSIRVIVYKGNSKIETVREQIGIKGYAVGFAGLTDWINGQLPANEEIGKALRTDARMYPEIAIRELVANSIIHQDFSVQGFPMIEIYSDRIEISNPGLPLISSERFIDEYISRNDRLADLMRRMGFCEEKGSGLDKVIHYNELYQLPAIKIQVKENRTTVCLYSYKKLIDIDKNEKIQACYQHACLKYVSNESMTNQSLRERFGIEDKNYSNASRIIRDTINSKMIKEVNPDNKSRKYASYLPYWA